MCMLDARPIGCVTDMTIEDTFTANGTGHENVIESLIKAYDNAPDIAIIFGNIRGEETTYISSFFSDHLYLASAPPCLTITSVNRSTCTIAYFYAVSTNLGVHAAPLRDITLPAPATNTVVIQKGDKAVSFLTATINFYTCTLKDVTPPAFTPALVSALRKKSIETKVRAVIGLCNNVIAPEELDINDTSYKCGTHDAYMSMTALSLPLARMIAQALWQPDLYTPPFSEAGKLDLNRFYP